MKTIATIQSPYGEKFGVPRQAGMVGCRAKIIFVEEYRVAEAIRGLEEFEYIWLIWGFHLAERESWTATVRPPRLGGNKRMGVFATRSPFRPNNIGLSSVRLISVEILKGLGPVLTVEGADLVDGTPIYDIKPYLPYSDSHPNAMAGFANEAPAAVLEIEDEEKRLLSVPESERRGMIESLRYDPRPHYHKDSEKSYVMNYGGYEVVFRVENGKAKIEDVCGEGNRGQ